MTSVNYFQLGKKFITDYYQRYCPFNQSRILGLEKQKGVIAPGADADFAILDRNYYVTQTYVRGRPVL